MEEPISKIFAKITRDEGEIWMSKIDFDYTYGQAKLSKEAAKHCVFSIIGGDFTGHYRFKKSFFWPIGYSHGVPGTHRHRVRIQNTGLARRPNL